MSEVVFKIADIPVGGRLILAPMDGISDPPFRAITRQLGSALSISEFINCLEYVHHKDKHVQRYTFEPYERPVGIQLLDNDPERMAETARRLHEIVNPDFFDVNLGCCVRSVTSRGAGAGLMRTPERIEAIYTRLRQAVPQPLTGKMRLGWDDEHLNYLEIGKLLQDCGASMVALHTRTTKMAYNGKARWQAIGELKAALTIPVIGNGDVHTPGDAQRMLNETGCDAVMIGRGALANPWIFSGRERTDVSLDEVFDLIMRQLNAMLDSYPSGALQAFRKYIKAYLLPYGIPRQEMTALLTCSDLKEFIAQILSIFTVLSMESPAKKD